MPFSIVFSKFGTCIYIWHFLKHYILWQLYVFKTREIVQYRYLYPGDWPCGQVRKMIFRVWKWNIGEFQHLWWGCDLHCWAWSFLLCSKYSTWTLRNVSPSLLYIVTRALCLPTRCSHSYRVHPNNGSIKSTSRKKTIRYSNYWEKRA